MPAAKRSDQRQGHRTNAEKEAAAPKKGQLRVPKQGPNPPSWLKGKIARDFYQSIRTSGPAVFYTDADWNLAAVLAHTVQTFVEKPSAMMLSSIHSMCGALAIGEGERRKAKIELEQRLDADDAEAAHNAKVSRMSEYLRRADAS